MKCNYKNRLNSASDHHFKRNNALNIDNVLVIVDAKIKDNNEIAAEIKDFSKKFGDATYTRDIIRRTEENILKFKCINVDSEFSSFVELPDDNGLVVVMSQHLSPDEVRVNRELISALGIDKYAKLQEVGIPISYEIITKGLCSIQIKSEDDQSEIFIYIDVPAA